jgi:raffinose/stachyose/melibiose transport system permease protein
MQNPSVRGTIPGRPGGTRHREERPLTIVLFLLPAFILFTIFVILPIANAVYTSLFKWNGLGPLDDFIGLKNYARLLKHDPFRKALIHNLVIIALSLGIQLPISLGLALLVGRKLPGRIFFRTIFFLPYVISQAITAYLWGFILNPRFTMIQTINDVLHTLYPPFESGDWLGNTDRVLVALFAVLTWQYFGLHMVLYIAGGNHRWGQPSTEPTLHHRADACQHDLYDGLPVRPGIITVVWPGVAHDRGGAGKRQ